MWPYPWTHVGTPSHLGHMDRVAATMPSQAHAGAAQEAPDIGQWEGQDVPLVRPSSCTVKGGIPSSRRYLPTYLPACRGARCRFSLVPLVLPSPVPLCGVVLAVCLPCPLPCARHLLGCWLPPVSFVALLLFTLSSTLLPGMHFFPASALVRVSVFFLAGSSFSLVGPCETKEGWGYVGLRRLGAVIM